MEEKKEKWLNYLALTTVLLALGATLSTLKSGSFSNLGILSQALASNKWSHYQSKSIKGYLFEVQKEKMEIDLKLIADTAPKQVLKDYQTKIAEYSSDLARYDGEKAQIKKEAEGFEIARDKSREHAKAFGVAVIMLQLAVLLNSIAGLMKKKMVWVLGLALGSVGLVYFVNGFLLFLPGSFLVF